MKDTLLFLVQQIVDHPDDVVVEETSESGKTVLLIHANAEDMGKIIGKSGRIIRAIRDIIKLIATKKNVYVDVVVADERTG